MSIDHMKKEEEVEITEEMLDASIAALRKCNPYREDYRTVTSAVFRAMLEVYKRQEG